MVYNQQIKWTIERVGNKIIGIINNLCGWHVWMRFRVTVCSTCRRYFCPSNKWTRWSLTQRARGCFPCALKIAGLISSPRFGPSSRLYWNRTSGRWSWLLTWSRLQCSRFRGFRSRLCVARTCCKVLRRIFNVCFKGIWWIFSWAGWDEDRLRVWAWSLLVWSWD